MSDMLQWLLQQGQGDLLRPFSLLLCFLLLFVFLFKNSTVRTKGKNLPPSPPKLPIIGNLHQVGRLPYQNLHNLAQRYGPLMLIHFGSRPTLIVSSPDGAREIMKHQDVIFACRPDTSFHRRLMYNNKDMVFSRYGDYWRQVRKICALRVLNLKRVHSFHPVRKEVLTATIENIQRSCSSSPSFSALVDISEVFLCLTNDIISRVALGKKYGIGEEGGGNRFRKLLSEHGYLLGAFNIGDHIPWLAWVNHVVGLEQRVKKTSQELDSFLDQVIDEHIHSASGKDEDGDNDADGGDEDFVEFLLRIKEDKSAEITLERENIKAMVLDMFAAGTDTSHTMLEWTMSRLFKHPEVMKEVQKEVRGVALTADKTMITEDDVENMHYLKAVLKETLRLHPSLPLLVPREASEDVKIFGYDIPAKTVVLINAWSIGRDPVYWDDPDKFNPMRFMKDGTSFDLKSNDFHYIPFGAGRRGCPGNHFAIVSVGLALANLLHRFDWALPNGENGEDLDLTGTPGISMHVNLHLHAVATPHY